MGFREGVRAVGLLAVLLVGWSRAPLACSSFMLDTPGEFLCGHNLDGESVVEGRVLVNPRGVFKRGHTLGQLTSPDGSEASPLAWVSRFESVTFNNLGLGFPDGGVNEAGLFVWEMSLEGTRFPADEGRPRLFMMQWVQHVLDTCSSVEEAVASARGVALDGWS